MDNGRYSETFKISKKYNLWVKLFKKNNLMISNYYTGLRPMAWKIYDIQTRPILNYLIRFFFQYFQYFSDFIKIMLDDHFVSINLSSVYCLFKY